MRISVEVNSFRNWLTLAAFIVVVVVVIALSLVFFNVRCCCCEQIHSIFNREKIVQEKHEPNSNSQEQNYLGRELIRIFSSRARQSAAHRSVGSELRSDADSLL